MTRSLFSEPWDFDLVEEDDGRLILTVVCSTVRTFEVVIELNDAETARFHEVGRESVIELKNRIVDDPAGFSDRNLNRTREVDN